MPWISTLLEAAVSETHTLVKANHYTPPPPKKHPFPGMNELHKKKVKKKLEYREETKTGIHFRCRSIHQQDASAGLFLEPKDSVVLTSLRAGEVFSCPVCPCLVTSVPGWCDLIARCPPLCCPCHMGLPSRIWSALLDHSPVIGDLGMQPLMC